MSALADGLRTIEELDVEGRRVLLRADLDVPLISAVNGTSARVADDARIRAALPTVEELRRRGARLVLVSHLGHPPGPDAAFSMRPVADQLAKLTGAPVALAPAVVGRRVVEVTERLAPGEMLLLENARFEPGETRNDPGLAAALAELGELYVNDAFAGAHHAHASNEGVAHWLPAAAGRLMEREILALSAIVERPARPLVTVIGGANRRDKAGLVTRFLRLADSVCLGGEMCFPFLAALGYDVGRSRPAPEDLESARVALRGDAAWARLELPRDLGVARWGQQAMATTARLLQGVHVPDGWVGLDIGPRTAERYAAEIAAAATVFWTGPMGRVELAAFAGGTRTVGQALALASATTVAAGGETIQALRVQGLTDRISHLSTGGAAALEFLEGRQLPGVMALMAPSVATA